MAAAGQGGDTPAPSPRLSLSIAAEADLSGVEAFRNPATVQAIVDAVWAFASGPRGVTIEVGLLAEAAHCEVHARFLDDPTPTDVIAFPYGDEDAFGEVLLNVDMARHQASRLGVTPCEELRLYLVHGCLHLLGYDDHEEHDRQAMRAAEAAVIARLTTENL